MSEPEPISRAALAARRTRIRAIARRLGFVGRVSYRHVYDSSGGASYRRGAAQARDELVVTAQAFERDRDPHDYTLEAIVAHERGHQVVAWHPAIAPEIRRRMGIVSEEVLASLIGAIMSDDPSDHNLLLMKATIELDLRLNDFADATRRLSKICGTLERLL